nr:myb-binding protein 1A [Onthophagus taurus]
MTDEESSEIKTEKIRDNVLEWFRKIGIDNEKVIVKNGAKLIGHLLENNSETGKNELKYALTRLIRGLGASSNSTKQGYYTVLVGLINCFDEIKICDVLEVGNKELSTSAGNSKSENADISAGQILLYGAIIRTGLFDKGSNEEKKVILQNLVSAGKKRSYLFLLAATFINQLCNNVDEDYFRSKIFPILSPELAKNWLEQSVDTLYLLFVLNDRFPKVVNKKFIKSVLGTEEIVSVKYLKELTNVLINMPRLETANHPVYDLLSKTLSQRKFAVDFVLEADKLLFKYNYNRHMVFTLILTSVISNLDDLSLLPRLITKNYIQQTLQYFKTVRSSKKPEQLQQKIYELLNKIVEVLNSDNITSQIKIDVIKKLLFDPGTFIFEKITRTKTIQQIINNLNQKEVDMVANLYKKIILSSHDDLNYSKSRFLNNDKVYASQLLVKLLNHDRIKDDFDWKLNQMSFLLELSFVRTGNNQIGVELMNSIKQSFFKCLTLKQNSFEGVKNMLWKLARKLNEHFKKSEVKSQDDIDRCWKKSFEMFEMVEKQLKNNNKDDSSTRLNHIYQTMFLFLGFHSFQDYKLTEESLIELENCFNRKNNQQKDELHFTEVLIDLFLCLLSYNSLLFRNLIKMVFPYFTKYLTDGAFLQVLFVLNPDNKNILKRKNDDDSENDSEDESNDLNDDLEDSSEDDDSSSESENEDLDKNDKLKDALQVVLGNFGDEEIDLDEMSESEGQKLDEALSVAFKHNLQKKNNSKQSHKDKLKMNFRIRALDLVDLYLENEPSLLICLEIVPILLRLEESAIKDPFQTQLLDRVRKAIKKLMILRKFENIEGIDEEKLKEFFLMFLDIIEKGGKNVYVIHALRESISNCCLFFVRSSQFLINSPGVDEEMKKFVLKTVTEVLGILIDSYFLNRESIVSCDLIKSIFRMYLPNLYDLVEKVLGFIYLEDLKIYKKIQAVNLVKEFFKNHRLLTSNNPGGTFKKSLNNFIVTTEEIFEFSVNNNSPLQEKFVSNLLDLLISIKTSSITTISCKKLTDLGDKYKERVKLTSKTKNLILKLQRVNLEEKSEDIDENEVNVEIVNDSVKKSKKNLLKRVDDIKIRLSMKRKLEDLVGEDNNNKRLKLINGDDEKINGDKVNDDFKRNKRMSLKIETKELHKSKAKKRQSSAF